MTPHPPTSQRLHENLGRIIASSAPGDRLLSEPNLARQLGVSRATLREAMRTFETQGLIHRRQGAGTFVSRPTHVIETGLEVLESIDTVARRIGLRVSLGKVEIVCRPATTTEATILSLPAEDKVLSVSRVILAEDHPAAYLVDILPEDVLSQAELEKGFSGSVLDVLLYRQTPPLVSSRCEIQAVTASTDIAHAMGIQRGDVLLNFEAYLYSNTGRIVDYSFSYFLPGYFRFHVVRRVG